MEWSLYSQRSPCSLTLPYLDTVGGCIIASSAQYNQLCVLVLFAHPLFCEGQQSLLLRQVEQSGDSVGTVS